MMTGFAGLSSNEDVILVKWCNWGMLTSLLHSFPIKYRWFILGMKNLSVPIFSPAKQRYRLHIVVVSGFARSRGAAAGNQSDNTLCLLSAPFSDSREGRRKEIFNDKWSETLSDPQLLTAIPALQVVAISSPIPTAHSITATAPYIGPLLQER